MVVALLLAACTAPPAEESDRAPADDTADHSGAPDDSAHSADSAEPDPRFDLAAPAPSVHGHFATAETCADCHAAVEGRDELRDAAGRPVGQFDLWRGSMMANAARDPFWWASVALETDPWPRTAEDIERVCVSCHAPALAVEARFAGEPLPTLADLRGHDDRARVGLDGVTCTVCHQIADQGLGTEAVDGLIPFTGEAVAWGPHAAPRAEEMVLATGYTPVEGAHLRDPGLCATCHSVTTTALNGLGEPTRSHFTEQAPFAEWSASAFAPTGATPRTCQDCHAPLTDEDGLPITSAIALADPPPEARAPFGRHTFFGANTVVPALLRDHADELRPLAPAEALDATVAGTRAFLRTAARLELGTPTRDGDQLAVPLTVVNLAGHKLPTGFPSRRMWLDVTVTDAAGAVVFRSGATDPEGRLVDGSGLVLPAEDAFGPVHPHRDALEPGEVQVWEHVLRDDERLPTIYLLLAFGSAKDDRILPAGWADPTEEIEPVGVGGDASFVAGSDTVTLLVPAPAAGGPYRVEAALRFQTIGARHLAELFSVEADAIRAFRRMIEASDRTPEVLAELSAELPEPVAEARRAR